jgi:DNA repair protein RadB
MERRLPTGCAPLDEVLGGGFRFGEVSLVYGEASTGKTTLALTCSLNHLRGDPWAKACYVDSDQKLSTKRLTQVAGDDDSLLERLLVWRPGDFSEQTEVIESLHGLPHGEMPVVVDSITGPYRLEAGDARRTFSSNKELNRQLGFLSETARAKGSAVLVVGQVHGVLGAKEAQVEPVAKRLLGYWSDAVLRLETTSIQSVRQAFLEEPPGRAGACRFMLAESGIKEAERAW